MIARREFCLGFGAVLLASPAFAQTVSGSRTGAQAAAALPPDVAFGRFVALTRAHLATGEELVGKREWNAAHPHFGFPREEIYGVIRDELRTYRTPPFDRALMDLARTVKTHNARQYPKALQKVDEALAAADASLKARQPDWPRFVLQVAIAVLKTAPDEYDDAYDKSRIVRPIGYQTARGFILQANRMMESVAPALEAKDPEALREMRGRFAQLEQAFAGIEPPKPPLMDEASVLGLVAKIEQAAAKLM